MSNDIISKLREPFAFGEIEWKVQVTTQDKARGMAVAYVDSRAIQKRLDEAIGPFCWSNEYQPWQEKSQVCKLSIYCAERGEWVTKSDGAENTDYEPVKGGLSDAFKRAASLWGIGRYLYEIDGIWVEIEPKGKGHMIKQNQYKVLESAYNQAVDRLFGSANASGSFQKQAKQKTPPQQSKPDVPPAQPSAPNPQPELNYEYKVQSIKPSGKDSCLLILHGKDGKQVMAYVKNDNNAMKEGVGLCNVKIAERLNNNRPYNVLEAYDLLDLAA